MMCLKQVQFLERVLKAVETGVGRSEASYWSVLVRYGVSIGKIFIIVSKDRSALSVRVNYAQNGLDGGWEQPCPGAQPKRRTRVLLAQAKGPILSPKRNVIFFFFLLLTHWGRMTQICVFNTRLFSLHITLNYAIHRACLRMVLLTDVYRNLTSLWIKL